MKNLPETAQTIRDLTRKKIQLEEQLETIQRGIRTLKLEAVMLFEKDNGLTLGSKAYSVAKQVLLHADRLLGSKQTAIDIFHDGKLYATVLADLHDNAMETIQRLLEYPFHLNGKQVQVEVRAHIPNLPENPAGETWDGTSHGGQEYAE